jgi:uncharacterized membrane protein YtjA (UPF0391 family)
MLIWAFICLVIAVIAAIICFKSKSPTSVLITKFILHLFLLLFVGFLIMAVFNSFPPPTKNKTLLPI